MEPVLVTDKEGLAKGWHRNRMGGELRVEFRYARKVRTLDTDVTATDEGAGNSKNLVGKKGDVERLRDDRGSLEEVEDGLVARFDGRNGSGRSEDARVLDKVCSTKERPDADV